MQTLEYSPLRDALRCDRLLRTLGRRIPPGVIHASDQNVFEQSLELVQALIRHDTPSLPAALTVVEHLWSLGLGRQDPDDCFCYLWNCLTALRLDMPLHDSQLYEFILFFSEFQSTLQKESDEEFAGFVSSSPE